MLNNKGDTIMSKAVIFFADGLEECEGLLVVDLLRRAGTEVIIASVTGQRDILSSHGICLQADVLAEDVDYDSADIVILPGGLKGTENLSKSSFVRQKCMEFAANKKVAAICAAPSILASLGLLDGKCATVHPNFEDKMPGAHLTHAPVTVDGNITTGQALGAAIPFALELVLQLEGEETVKKVSRGICFPV
jgi:4-methyl-5(b-hydroxyethyl)-thiazole monophosphate biosynthesis